jgi:hypothetical protein
MTKTKTKVTPKIIGQKIHFIRNQWVFLDVDLALVYGVETRQIKQAVDRNRERFPSDFMIILDEKEYALLRSDSKYLQSHVKQLKNSTYAFTDLGMAMLSSVLKSIQAIAINVQVMRVFVKKKADDVDKIVLSKKENDRKKRHKK